MSDSMVRGRFVWHELLTTDTKAAANFFPKVFGWKTQPWGDDGYYTLFLAGTQQVGGLMALPEDAIKMGATSHWMNYIGTDNVDETARQAVSLGGKIVKAASDIPTVGRYAILSDPQGAMFGLYTSIKPPSGGAVGNGDFSWHELGTSDVAAAMAFYSKLFGWSDAGAHDMGPEMGVYQMFGQGGAPTGGIFKKSAQMPGPNAWLAYTAMADAKKVAAAVVKAGGKVMHGPAEVPGGDIILTALDPQGAAFAVHARKAAAVAAPAPAAKKAAPKAKKQAGAKKAAAKKAKPAPMKAAVKKKAKPAKKSKPMKKNARPAAKKKAAAPRAKKRAGSKK